MPLHLLQIAKKLAHDAGLMALSYQKKGFKVQEKDRSNNLVTDADKACDELIVKTIRTNFPDHTIISEESGTHKGSSDYKWIIDPIDGTSNFIHGLPLFAVSIAVAHKGKPIIGVVEVPGLKETYWAKHGQGAYLGRKRIHVSQNADLQKALLATGFPYDREHIRFQKSLDIYGDLQKQCRGVRRIGSAAMDLAFLAAGRFDAFYEYGLEAWDIAAGKIILEEAGGMMTNMDGSTLNPALQNCLASNGLIHSKMMEVIKKHGGEKV